jgi:hypothetical protein
MDTLIRIYLSVFMLCLFGMFGSIFIPHTPEWVPLALFTIAFFQTLLAALVAIWTL